MSLKAGSTKHLSPFRYPGGKTWFVPMAKEWVEALDREPKKLLEPFAGGGIVSLSLVASCLVESAHLVEIDEEIASVWKIIINSTDNDVAQLVRKISEFEISEHAVREMIETDTQGISTVELAFRTIVKNRSRRAGIMAPGAGLIKAGDRGKGIAARWCPDTLANRIALIREMRSRLSFSQGDAFEAIEANRDSIMFIDPPYTAGGKSAGARLYRHHSIDHEKLFETIKRNPFPALITYDDSNEVRAMVARYGFRVAEVDMWSSHHKSVKELCIFKGSEMVEIKESEMLKMRNDEGVKRYFSAKEACEMLNISRTAFYRRTPPEADAVIGDVLGWTEETLREWDAIPRKRGKRAKKKPQEVGG